MSGFEPKASFITLPPELMRLIVSDPVTLHNVRVGDNSVEAQSWLAIKHDWDARQLKANSISDPSDTLQLLRCLSQVCRSLRMYALPLLWEVVHVSKVSELGQIYDLLSSAPNIAPLIRHFSFFWTMNGDFDKCNDYPREHGSLLDMAFIGRGALWDAQLREAEDEAEAETLFYDEDYDHPVSLFNYGDVTFIEPGSSKPGTRNRVMSVLLREGTSYAEFSKRDNLIVDQEYRTPSGEVFHSYAGPHVDRVGPDGNGPDRRIKSAKEFSKVFTAVVEQLCNLETFRWCSPVTPIPAGVFEALKKAPRLTTFHTTLESQRGTVHALPLWQLAPKLAHLSIERIASSEDDPHRFEQLTVIDETDVEDADADFDFMVHQAFGGQLEPEMTHETMDAYFHSLTPEEQQELSRSIDPLNDMDFSPEGQALIHLMMLDEDESHEQELTSCELPAAPDALSAEARQTLHYAIVSRTIVAAARGGKLRSLNIPDPAVQQPFGIGALMPFWVGVEEWYWPRVVAAGFLLDQWHEAAATLRKSLNHASRWLTKRDDRRLTAEDLQGWYASYKHDEAATGGASAANAPVAPWKKRKFAIELYLPWLEADEGLAEEVARAWQAVLERGEADVVKCDCERCEVH